MEDMLKKSDAEILAIAKQLRVAYGLKRTLRYSTKRNHEVHSESVAEHIFGLMFLAEYFLEAEPEARSVNSQKLHRVLLFHDFGEIKNGDVPYHLKTEAHSARERVDAAEIFSSLPRPFGEKAHASWQEYEMGESPEARFAYALDKIEPLFELLDPINEASMKRLNFSFEQHIGVKHEATADFPVMRRFVDAISNDMRTRGVFSEKE